MATKTSTNTSSLQGFLKQIEASGAGASVVENVRISLGTIETAVQQYGTEKLAISFNGGKDCTVLLDLLSRIPGLLSSLKVFYINNGNANNNHRSGNSVAGDNFPELTAFIESSVRRYGIRNFHEVREHSIKAGLDRIHLVCPSVEAIFLGVRATDPFCARLRPFQPTDKGWAPLVRVSPILQWSYSNVWSYLRAMHVPYCCLYDAGYTSLGKKSETVQNPLLLKSPGVYYPAHMLKDESAERRGRHSSIKSDAV